MSFRIEDYDLSQCNEFEEVYQLSLEFYELKNDLETFLNKINNNLKTDYVLLSRSPNKLQSLTKEIMELILFFTQE